MSSELLQLYSGWNQQVSVMQLRTARISPKLHAMSTAATLGSEQLIRTRYPVQGQFTGRIYVVCPSCGNLIRQQLNWNTWRIRCRVKSCKQMLLLGLHVRIPSKDGFRRKYVRPVDTVLPISLLPVLEWNSGDPVHCLVTDE
jgi:hypothetical protein